MLLFPLSSCLVYEVKWKGNRIRKEGVMYNVNVTFPTCLVLPK